MCEEKEHEHTLVCFSDLEADVETQADWEKCIEGVELIGNWPEDIIATAEPAQIHTIEGNADDCVKYVTYDQDDEQILGFVELSENSDQIDQEEKVTDGEETPMGPMTLISTGEDYTVQVSFTEED